MWMVEASFKDRGADAASNITPSMNPKDIWLEEVVKCPKCRSCKGCWEFKKIEHGNLTSNRVILYQEIQFPGMDVVFYVYPYTLPVYPHPASEPFPFLMDPPFPHQRPPCPFWRSASLKSLSQPSVTDVPGHLPSTPMAPTYTRADVITRVTSIWIASYVQWHNLQCFLAPTMMKFVLHKSG